MAWDDATINCCKCGTEFTLPRSLYNAAKCSPAISFYCPYGHGQHFVEGETEAQRLRRERDRLAQQLAHKDDVIAMERDEAKRQGRKAAAARGQVTRLKNRAKAGVCPCCNRTFQNLKRHMETQHPDFASAEKESA